MSELLVGIDSLKSAHRAFFGVHPNPTHLRMYEAFPLLRGKAGTVEDVEVFEATLIMAIVQTYPKHQRPSPYKCYFFVPAQMDKWALETLGTVAKRMFDVLKEKKRVEAARELGKLFHHILMGCRVLQFREAPERWVAFGFQNDELIPEWLKSGLLT